LGKQEKIFLFQFSGLKNLKTSQKHRLNKPEAFGMSISCEYSKTQLEEI